MNNANSIHWDDARDARLKELFQAVPRLSFKDIGHALGVSRNSAIGRAGRLGLTRGVQFRTGMGWIATSGTGPRRIRKAAPIAPAAGIGTLAKDAPPTPQSADVGRLSIMELDGTTCRYPIDVDGGFLFCGMATQPGSVYCCEHHARCRIPRGSTPARPYFSDRSK